ncbi:hypothetical protein FKW77_003599 [Venturia effusa]|uniref:Uncharacterized protein n=1 Tax=Venturia effusa TaxID=50376 RepID=A0A517LNN6_9PEZI|nr:hypothetical protein FKW77_003599 [Venturia effusa]
MATSVGHINGKPIFGPPRPPPEILHCMDPNYVPFSSYIPRPPPSYHTCPASYNGWTGFEAQIPSKVESTPWSGKSDCGLFDRLPRELRDRIYAEAVALRFSKDDVRKLEYFEATKCPTAEILDQDTEVRRLVQVEVIKESATVYPGATCSENPDLDALHPCGGKAISDNLGLLLANRQIHNEATEVFFSTNYFATLVELCTPARFWNCNRDSAHGYSSDCNTPEFPCLIPPRHMKHIKHLVICIKVSDHVLPWCGAYAPEMEMFVEKLEHIVKTLLLVDIKLKTLEIRFANIFNGQLGYSLREPFDCKERLEDGSYQTVLAAATPNLHIHIVQTEEGGEMWLGSAGQRSPIRHYNVLKPVLKLKGRVEYFKVSGDLPTKYLEHVCKVMDEDANPSVPMKILREREEKAAADRKAYLSSKELRAIWKEKWLKLQEEEEEEEE